ASSAAYEKGDAQSPYAAPSSEHEKELDVSLLANANAAERSEVSAGGADTIVVSGAVVSIRNGPMCDASLQLPVDRPVRRWNHQEPSASGSLVVPVAVSSIVFPVPGSVSLCADHAYENPSTPLLASA